MNEKKINRMSEQITGSIAQGLAESIGESIAKVMQPVFENITVNLHQVIETMKQEQLKSNEQMVQAFIGELQHTAVDRFSGITQQIKELSKLEEKNILLLKEVLQGLQLQSEQNATLLRDMKEYQKEQQAQNISSISLLDDNQKSISSNMEELKSLYALTQEHLTNASTLLEQQSKLIEAGKAQEATYIEQLQMQKAELYDTMTQQTVAMVKEVKEQVATLTKQWTKRQEEMSEHLSAIREATMEQQNSFAKDFTECKRLIDESAATSLLELRDTAEAMKGYSEALQSASTHLTSGFNEFNENMEQSVVKVFEAMDAQLAQIAKTLSDTANEINDSAAAIPKALKCSIEDWKSKG